MNPAHRGQRLAVVIGCLLALPGFAVGYYNDDFIHSIVLRGLAPGFSRNPLRLYEFTRGDAHVRRMVAEGLMPWWTASDLRLRFFRPLSSLLVALDHTVSPRSTVFTHVHALAWFTALLVTAAWVLRRALPAREATVATFAYAVATHHATASTWTSARAGLAAGVMGLVAFALHLRARDRGARVAWLAAGAMVLALCFGEIALGAVAMIVAWEALAAPGTRADRARAAAPVFVITAGYLAMYTALGFGVRASGGYFDPAREPIEFALAGLVRWPVLLAEPVWNVPSEVLMFAPRAARSIALVAAAILAALGVCVVRAGRKLEIAHRRGLAALVAGAVVAVVPGLGGVPGGRVLPIAGIGIAAAVGTALVSLWDGARTGPVLRRVPSALAAVLLALPIALLGPFVRVMSPLGAARVARTQSAVATTAEWRCGDDGDAIIPLAADPAISMYIGAAILDAGRHARSLRVLSSAPARHALRRDDARSFTLRVLDGGRMLETGLELVYRAPSRRLHVGQTIASTHASVTVTAMNGPFPTALRFTADRSLDDRGVCLLEWRGGTLRPLAAPAIGDEIVLEHEPGPMGM